MSILALAIADVILLALSLALYCVIIGCWQYLQVLLHPVGVTVLVVEGDE
jgi:hypothetical protein